MKKAIMAVALLAGCAATDLGATSTTYPTDDPKVFKWRTMADAIYPIDSPRAEQQRLDQLKRPIAGNCPAGGDVIKREPVVKVAGSLGTTYDVFYTFRCR